MQVLIFGISNKGITGRYDLHVIFLTAGLQTRLRGDPPNAPSSLTSPYSHVQQILSYCGHYSTAPYRVCNLEDQLEAEHMIILPDDIHAVQKSIIPAKILPRLIVKHKLTAS